MGDRQFEEPPEEEEFEEEVKVFVEGLDEIPPDEALEEDRIPAELKGLTKAQLVEKIRANQEELGRASDSGRVLKEAIDELGRTLKPAPVPQSVAQGSVESDTDYEERLKTDFLDHPKKALDEYLQRSVGPLVSSVASGSMQVARELVRMQKGPDTFDRYVSEIDAVVSRIPVVEKINKPREVYERAYNEVMSGHLDELITARVAEEMAKLQGTGKTESAQAGIRAPFGSTQVRPASKQKRIVLTEREREVADRKGLDYMTYAKIYKGA